MLDGNSVYTSSADNVVRQWEKVSNAVAVQGGGGGEGGRGKRLVYPPGASAYMGDLAGNSDDGVRPRRPFVLERLRIDAIDAKAQDGHTARSMLWSNNGSYAL